MSGATLEHKASSGAPDAGLLGSDDQTGVVEAIVSVTGVRDHDNDVIEPGAYAKTLKNRRPKGIFSHDWGRWVARTEHIEELMPGDPRLPAATKDGQPWPEGAGGLYVRARFNLATREGKDGYENVKFFSETGECEWSVGYRVPPGKATKDKAGTRRIKEMDLFEFSPVLFGANSMSSTLAVKSAEGAEPEPDEFVAAADTEAWQELEDEADQVPDEELDAPDGPPDEEDAQEDEAPAEEEEADPEEGAEADEEDAHDTGDTSDGGAQEEGDTADGDAGDAGDDGDAADGAEGEKGSSASLNRSPRQNWVEKAGELPAYVREIARSIHEKRGMPLEQAIPIAIAQIKKWAAGGGGVNADTRAKAVRALAEWEKLKAASHAKKDVKMAEDASQEVIESETYPHLPGTYEELREQIRLAAVKVLGGAHVEVMGTWPDHAVVTAYGEDGRAKAYEVPYSVTSEGATAAETVTLAEPEAVELTVAVDGVEEPGEALLPFASQLADVTAGLKTWLTHAPESKAGRVLSAVNERRLLGAVESLVAVLKAAGLNIDTKPRQADEKEEDEPSAETVLVSDSTAPSARPDNKALRPEGTTLLDPALLARGYRLAADASSRRM